MAAKKVRIRELSADDLGKHVTYKASPGNITTGRLNTVAHAKQWTELNVETRGGSVVLPFNDHKILETVTVEITD